MFVLKIFKSFIQTILIRKQTFEACFRSELATEESIVLNETKLSEENVSVCKGTWQENRDNQDCSRSYRLVFTSVTLNCTDEIKLLVLART